MSNERARGRRDLIWTPRKSPQGYYFPLLVYYDQHFISADYEELFTVTGPRRPSYRILHNKCVLFLSLSLSPFHSHSAALSIFYCNTLRKLPLRILSQRNCLAATALIYHVYLRVYFSKPINFIIASHMRSIYVHNIYIY